MTGETHAEARAVPGVPEPPRAGATPGLGLGWTRLAAAVAEQIPPAEIARIWLFLPVRRNEREWGTAVIARRTGDARYRVYTGRYMLVARGRERGQGRLLVEDVGESPEEVVADVIRGVQDRAGEAEPPVEIEPALWYPDHDEPAAEG